MPGDGSSLPPFDPTNATFTYTQPPNPGWRYGEGLDKTEEGRKWLEGEKEGWTIIDTSDPTQRLYPTFISGIVPRPVAFVSSISASGIENLAPFSWFNQVTTSPPVISISIFHTPQGPKDTTRNIRETKGFTVNVISEPWIQQANCASIDAPSEVSEWEMTGLTRGETIFSKAPRVKGSAFSMECELLQAIDITHPPSSPSATPGSIAATLILGTVKFIHIRNDVLDPTRPGAAVLDMAKFKPIARLGGVAYGRIGEGYVIPRESWSVKGAEIGEVLRRQRGEEREGEDLEGKEGKEKL